MADGWAGDVCERVSNPSTLPLPPELTVKFLPMKFRPPKTIQLIAAALMLAPLAPVAAADKPDGGFATFTSDGAWCWFSDPRAIYRYGKIFAGWMTSDGSVQIGAMTAATGAVQIVTLAPRFEADDHDSPSLLFLPDGRLAVFYSKHSNARGDMHLRTTSKPEDISEWSPDRELGFLVARGRGVTYSNPAMLSDEGNAIYVFWRGGDWKPTFSVSKDLGQTWSPPRTVIERPGTDNGNRPYVKAWNDGKGRIDLIFTDGHPRNESTNSVYFLRYEKGVFSKADGTRVGGMQDLPLDPAKCDRVYDGSTAGRGWIWDIAEQDGRPAIAYTRMPTEDDHRYCYARWTGKEWKDSPVAPAGKWFPQTPPGKKEGEPHYSAGMAIDPRFVDTLYLSAPANGIFEIEKWRTPDGGQSWQHEPITQHSTSANIRPFAVRNAPPGSPNLMWMNLSGHYIHYTKFLTSLQINRSGGGLPPPSAATATPPTPATSRLAGTPPAPGADRPGDPALPPSSAAILAVMRRVGDWQLANGGHRRTDDWIAGAGYTGIMALAEVSGDAKYRDAMRAMSEANGWKLGPKEYFADDHVVGQTYGELFLHEHDPKMIAPMRTQFDAILAAPQTGDLDIKSKGVFDKWSWCDALFMAPPAWVRLWAATGDRRYLDFAVEHWWQTSDYLYDKQEHLFFRDSGFFGKREANGGKVFWARGNGWVIGGLARVLQFLPKDHPARPLFEQQFREMAARLLTLQQSDGMWRASLLDPESFPMKETSGTGLICYGLAWGVNNGLLDRTQFAPAVKRAWQALAECVEADGRLTHVQPVGAAPKKDFDPEHTDSFGVGAVLLAGSEVCRLAGTK